MFRVVFGSMHPHTKLDHQFMLVHCDYLMSPAVHLMDASSLGKILILSRACAQLMTTMNWTAHWSDV